VAVSDPQQPSGQPGGPVYDLSRIIRDSGWSEARVSALRNTCAAASAKTTLPAAERDLAAAITAALDGRAAGITAEQLETLIKWGLLDPTGELASGR
jgi:hypothetical protein